MHLLRPAITRNFESGFLGFSLTGQRSRGYKSFVHGLTLLLPTFTTLALHLLCGPSTVDGQTGTRD
jgi:hypothetical protein